jgi:hypothetical protein
MVLHLITKGREGRGSLLRCLHRDDQKNAFNRITATTGMLHEVDMRAEVETVLDQVAEDES